MMAPRKGALRKQVASLKEYRARRDFSRTSEPEGLRSAQTHALPLYAIQMHRARRLHFDLRLELDGVLKSWAVTKGPSLDPTQKRLAVRTEDHPIEYGPFEGVIPKGEYGGGGVMLWDKGTWKPQGDPHEGLENGLLKFILKGERLRGGFALVRLPPRSKEKRENWLLVKERDEWANGADPVTTWTTSVATGKTLDEIAAADEPPLPSPNHSHARGAGNDALPRFRPPQLATAASKPPSGAQWLHEIKYDGYRVLAAVADSMCKLYTRSGLDWTCRFHPLEKEIALLRPRSALIDGEVVVMDEKGRSDFARLQQALTTGGAGLRFCAFDLLELNGVKIDQLPLVERKSRLAALLRGAPPSVIYSDHVAGDGERVLAKCCALGLEGIVSKRADQPYVSRRALSWVKTKCSGRDEFVIGGWRPSSKKDRPFSSLLLGEFDEKGLRYRGRVGTGFDEADLAQIAQKLRSLAREVSPFMDAPRDVTKHARWVEPRLVAEISYAERTREGYLRHPSFIALREDKPAAEVRTGERLQTDAPSGESEAHWPAPSLTHPDKVLFPDIGVTKIGLADYWSSVADLALPHIRGRPLTLVRCPEGAGQECFFQRHHAQGMPEAIKPAPIRDHEGKLESFLQIDDAEGLASAAQIGALEVHVWGAHVSSIDFPDRLVFDLDPGPGLSFSHVSQAAMDFRALLEAANLTSFALLTGSKGVHVVAPLAPELEWEQLGAFAKGVAKRLASDEPGRFTSVMTKARRTGKIYIDWRRNERGASAIAPYSPRRREHASVAAPVGWNELARVERADVYTIANLHRRIASLRGRDPWEGYFTLKQRISKAAMRFFAAEKA